MAAEEKQPAVDVPAADPADAATAPDQTVIQDGPPTAAGLRLGSEGLSRLRARHAEVLTRIAEKVGDPVRSQELKLQAERLNPDTWVTDAEVTAGLEEYETVFEALRAVVGRRKKRRRRRAGADSSRPTEAGTTPADDDEGDDGGRSEDS